MPTYKNDTNDKIFISSTRFLEPGQEIESLRLLDGLGLTKISNTPYYNPVKAVHSTISSSGVGDPTTITLQKETNDLEIYNTSTATVTVLLNDSSNTPGYKVPASSTRTLKGIKNFVESIVLQFSESVSSGEVIVHEMNGG